MSTNHTKNYNLCQWEAEDKVLRTDFNEDNEKLDAALAGLSQTVSTLSGTVSGHTGRLSQKGNCQIYTTTYTGDGGYGASHPKTINCPGRPRMVFIMKSGVARILTLMYNGGIGVNIGSNSSPMTITWGGSSVRWYSEQSASAQYTESGAVYHVLALLDMS